MKTFAIAALLTTWLAMEPALAQVPNLPPPPPPSGGSSGAGGSGTTPRRAPEPPPSSSSSSSASASGSASGSASASGPGRAPRVARSYDDDSVPPARTGFQLALRTGYMLPFGNAAQGVKMSDTATGQFPLLAEIGAKIIPSIFVGGYLGLGFGGATGALKRELCNTGPACLGVSFRAGIEAQYHIQPGEKLDPWVGLGIGIESLSIGVSQNGNDTSRTLTGIEWMHLMGGLDVRLSRLIAVGPVADLALGTYSHESAKTGSLTSDASIATTATHGWFMLGARVTFLP